MKVSKKAWLSTLTVGALTAGLAVSALAGTTYEATFYVAGMGGHFAKAECSIDPAAETPITCNKLTKVDIGDSYTHPVHDARIDNMDRNTMFWSTYKIDQETGMTHVGKTDLRTGEVLQDVNVPTADRVKLTKAMYCASGQTEDYFMPITMSNPSYIDVFSKKDLQMKQRVFLEGTEADPKVPYKYFHGTSSPDMSKMLITINESDASSLNDYGNGVGKMHMKILDTKSLEKGKVKLLASGIADGNKKSTISFRQYWSNDSSMIANATGDILFLIDANTLEVIDAETMPVLEQTHDAMFTPDDRYIVATSRTKSIYADDCQDRSKPGPDEYLMDGELKLYDVKAKKFIGKATSVCLACHDKEIGSGDEGVHAVLCGLDAEYK
ncbi:MAG: hypothetical protein C0613_05270 [Desulfobulbaceae bacterium]|nr:MAG: hypothetical protein C0613_05270 [Desulfobulbaceae bacterium]